MSDWIHSLSSGQPVAPDRKQSPRGHGCVDQAASLSNLQTERGKGIFCTSTGVQTERAELYSRHPYGKRLAVKWKNKQTGQKPA